MPCLQHVEVSGPGTESAPPCRLCHSCSNARSLTLCIVREHPEHTVGLHWRYEIRQKKPSLPRAEMPIWELVFSFRRRLMGRYVSVTPQQGFHGGGFAENPHPTPPAMRPPPPFCGGSSSWFLQCWVRRGWPLWTSGRPRRGQCECKAPRLPSLAAPPLPPRCQALPCPAPFSLL